MRFVEKFFFITPEGVFEQIPKTVWNRFLSGTHAIKPYAHGYAYVAQLILEVNPEEGSPIFDAQFFRYPVSQDGLLDAKDRKAFERARLRKGGEAVRRALEGRDEEGGTNSTNNTIELKSTLEFRRYEWKPAHQQLDDLWSKVA